MNTSPGFVADFREAAPYIHYLRGKTLVIGITDSLLEGDTLNRLAADFHLLAGLGVRLVLVHGTRHFLNRLAADRQFVPQYHRNRRITDDATLRDAKQAVGMIRSDIEAALCSSASAPLRNKPIPTASGNFLTARPLGVIDGIDMGYTGIVRKTDTDSINRRLDDGAIVLISPLGHSYGGKTFNLSMSEAAEAVAVALQAEKLVYLTEEAGICNAAGVLMSTLSSGEVRHLIETAHNVPFACSKPPSTPSKTASAAYKSSAGAKTADCCANSSPEKAAAPPSPAIPSSPSAKPTAATSPASSP